MTSGPGQFGTDQLGWTAQFGMNIKKAGSELSPGSRKNLNHITANLQKQKKNLYGEDDENDPNNADLYFSQFGKENISTSSATSQSFSSNLYGQPISTSLSGMNNLGLQQPPSRSIPNSSSHSGFGTGPSSVGGRMISSSVGAAPGHITPTNTVGSIGMNLPTSNSFALSLPSTGVLPSTAGGPQQQSSPNRNILSMASSRGILGQRQVGAGVSSASDLKRPALSIGANGPLLSGNSLSNMSAMGFGMSAHNSRFGVQGMMGGLPTSMSTAFSANAAIDLSEFPSLNNRGGRADSGSTTPNMSSGLMSGRPPYVGMVKQPVTESSEFQIHSEDFPALPGSQGLPDGINSISNNGDVTQKTVVSYNIIDSGKEISGRSSSDKNLATQKRGIHTSSDGIVTNIPGGMVMDQFGMVGLLTFIRAAETDPNLVTLALGSDLTTLGLNLNSPENLYPSFGGPWAEHPCRPQDVDYHVPHEYLTNLAIRDKLAPVKLNRYGEDLLFYIFYTNGGDILQVAAAAELFSREWRYHKDDQVWITRAPGMTPTEKTSTYERGTYYFFDAHNWRKVAKEFHLEYSKLEDRPHMPQKMAQFL